MGQSVLYSDEQMPPDDATRIAMFLDAVEDYYDLQKAHPLPRSYPLLKGLDREQYWIVMLHAAVLRKFFADRQVMVSAVLESVRNLILEEDPDMMRDLQDFKEYTDAKTVPVHIGLKVGDHDVTQWEVVQVELYGRHLHADFGKWQASTELRDGRWEVHVGQWCGAAAWLLEVADMKIRWYAENGYISFKAQDGKLSPWSKLSRGSNESRSPQNG